ncbi:TPA: hypothetical protein N0F65_010644 [Lagenidium giganteum]|uniref:Phosphatidate cytidylyltransferase n=1 Tax=Lagenidium giganteum TaxID=4803 RepID=A0AAV2ZCE4_9STRA|nr:TPA: hypothetical protein N0F65_010644 [Lagenidium giganteum]
MMVMQVQQLDCPDGGFSSGFEREYTDICVSIDEADWYEDALTPQTKITKAKNRYRDVLPFEHTRVRLPNPHHAPGGDYINANYIDDDYIACCAPIPNVMHDFWSMVWHSDVHVILMLTNFVERERLKADIYWDARGKPVDFRGIFVQLLEEESHPMSHGFLIRKFKVWLQDQNGREVATRIVLQVQLTIWPDHGVLRDFRVIAPMLQLVNAYKHESSRVAGVNTRVIVHCSAGIGRSGTFIAIDILLKSIEAALRDTSKQSEQRLATALDVRRVVHHIRSQRPGMVQTPSSMSRPSVRVATPPTWVDQVRAFLALNAVQRVMSALVLAPLVTVFLWDSPAIATATVCAFVTSACTYEYAWLCHRIGLRVLPRLEATPLSPASASASACRSASDHDSFRSRPSSSTRRRDAVEVAPGLPHTDSRPDVLMASQSLRQSHTPLLESRVDEEHGSMRRLDQHELRRVDARLLQRCAVSNVAERWFCGNEWVAAIVLSTISMAVTSTIFLICAPMVGQLRSTEFYESRYFFAFPTDFFGSMCAFFTPNWSYAFICLIENVVFTLLTMHSTICPINQFSCGLSVEPAQIFLTGMLTILIFRFTTTRKSGPAVFLAFLLDLVGLLYIVGSLSVIVAFVDDNRKTLYRKLLIVLLYVVWASDSGAYFTGKLLAYCRYKNYHPLAAHLSKNKDYEGTLGAIVFGIAAMFIATAIVDVPGSPCAKIIFTILAVIIGRLGDLFESLLKRAAGVKDSGKLIPGHGGMLDRIDALMFASLVFARYYAMVMMPDQGRDPDVVG